MPCGSLDTSLLASLAIFGWRVPMSRAALPRVLSLAVVVAAGCGIGAVDGGASSRDKTQGDTTPPVLSNGLPTGTLARGSTTISMSVETDEPAECKWDLADNIYASMASLFVSTRGTLHNTPVTGLGDGQSYTYYVRCQDASGNANTTSYVIRFNIGSFLDTAPPVPGNGQPTGVLATGTTSAILSVTTNEAATCKWDSSSPTSYADMANTFSSTGATSHSTQVTGLVGGQSYAYYVRCQDASGNSSTASYLINFSVTFPNVVGVIPALNFSDITSGPKTGNTDGAGGLTSAQHGAIVTIWGNYLGSPQGTSKIYIMDSMGIKSEVAHYYYWKHANGQLPGGPADLSTYHKMQEIAFSLPASVADGNATIIATINGVNSNPLPFTVRDGSIRFIRSTGNDSFGDGSWGSPWVTLSATVRGGNSKLVAGDIVYSVGVGASSIVKVGEVVSLIGTSGSPYSLVVYPNTTAVVVTSGTAFKNWTHGNTVEPSAYWNFSKFTIDTGYEAFSIFGYARYIGNNVTGVIPEISYSGFVGGSCPPSSTPSTLPCSGHMVLGNEVHDYGDPTGQNNFHHLIYISNRSGTTAEAYEIGWNYFHDNTSYQGIHIYDYAGNPWTGTFKIHHNAVKNQAGNAININNPSAADYNIYNNIVVLDTDFNPPAGNFSAPSSAIRIDNATYGTLKVYGNTFYGYAATNNMTAALIDYKSNIMIDSRNVAYGSSVGSGFTQSDNLFYSVVNQSLALPPWASGALNADPKFANAAAYDFSLQTGSPACSAGSDDILTTVVRDFFGQPRQAGEVSIGAIQ